MMMCLKKFGGSHFFLLMFILKNYFFCFASAAFSLKYLALNSSTFSGFSRITALVYSLRIRGSDGGMDFCSAL